MRSAIWLLIVPLGMNRADCLPVREARWDSRVVVERSEKTASPRVAREA